MYWSYFTGQWIWRHHPKSSGGKEEPRVEAGPHCDLHTAPRPRWAGHFSRDRDRNRQQVPPEGSREVITQFPLCDPSAVHLPGEGRREVTPLPPLPELLTSFHISGGQGASKSVPGRHLRTVMPPCPPCCCQVPLGRSLPSRAASCICTDPGKRAGPRFPGKHT